MGLLQVLGGIRHSKDIGEILIMDFKITFAPKVITGVFEIIEFDFRNNYRCKSRKTFHLIVICGAPFLFLLILPLIQAFFLNV